MFRIVIFQKYTLSQKNICTQKKLKQNHKTFQEYNLTRHMQMIKILCQRDKHDMRKKDAQLGYF